MSDYSVDAELGRQILRSYRKNAARLETTKAHLAEAESRRYLAASSYGERVDHSLIEDQHEKLNVHYMFVQEETGRMEANVTRQREMIRRVLKQVPADSAQLLQDVYLEEDPVRKEDIKKSLEETKLLKAYEEFWNAYEIESGSAHPILIAKNIRIWKRYYDHCVQQGLLTKEEADLALQNRLQMDSRQIRRKLRLLHLLPELQNLVILGRLSEMAAYEISFLKISYQYQLAEIMQRERTIPTVKQAHLLRSLSFSEWYHEQKVRELLHG